MKKIIVPLVIALLMGLGGASGFSYVSAKKTAAIVAEHRADSIKTHVKDSTAAAEKAEQDEKAKAKAALAEAAVVDSTMMTPADSIRALKHLPTTLRDATLGLSNAPDAKPGVLVVKAEVKPDAKAATNPKIKTTAPEAVESALPEHRIAKIFGAMQSKDAAKVLEQMNDSDVRVILSMMSDKQAAVILSSFSPQHAAAISRGDLTKPDKKPAGAKP